MISPSHVTEEGKHLPFCILYSKLFTQLCVNSFGPDR